MKPHWHDENGAYCEEHAPDVEGDLNSNECDCPQNCQVCGRPCEYTLTADGIKYVMDRIRETLDGGPEVWNQVRSEPNRYYDGSRQVAVVRDWAEDLCWYSLGEADKWLVDYFLRMTAETAVDMPSVVG